MSISNNERMASKNEVAAFLGITVRTLELKMKAGLIPYLKIGRTVRFSIPEVRQTLNERCGRNREVLTT
jgi:excisionase family DNA binding protein